MTDRERIRRLECAVVVLLDTLAHMGSHGNEIPIETRYRLEEMSAELKNGIIPSNFSYIRTVLQAISEVVGDGYLVSCAWDGALLRVSVGRHAHGPDSWRKPWVMTFDSETDYSIDPAKLIADLAHGAKVWFGSSKDQADEIERLLNLVEAKSLKKRE